MTRDYYVLCEGFHDRDFIAGWFENVLGWSDPTNGGRRPIRLFAGEDMPKGGQVFESDNSRVCLIPAGGRQSLSKRLAEWLGEVTVLPLGYSGVVVVADGDHSPLDATDPVEDMVRQALVRAGSSPVGSAPWKHSGIVVDYVSMRVGAIADAPSLPDRENLERVVCAAFARAHPLRFQAVAEWLRSRPESSHGPVGKAMNWSIMAGWFAELGCTEFLRRAIWRDEAMLRELRRVLDNTRLPTLPSRLRGS